MNWKYDMVEELQAIKRNNTWELVELGFIKCRYEYGVYAQVVAKDITIIFLYVDDLLVTGNSLKNLSNFKEMMIKEFGMSDLGSFSYFLSMKF